MFFISRKGPKKPFGALNFSVLLLSLLSLSHAWLSATPQRFCRLYIIFFSVVFKYNWHILLSHFSHVWLCATPYTAAHWAPPSLGFSRQEHWSGLPFPSLMHESEVAQSCPTLHNPHGLQPTRLLHPWDFPGKSTGVGCHCLLQLTYSIVLI